MKPPTQEKRRWAVPLLRYFEGPVSPERSRTMAKVRVKHTKPELLLRRALWRAGVRYRLHPRDVAGRPDVVVRKHKVAVFVDGCFWHGCPEHYREPRTRVGFWREKLARNVQTRERVRAALAPDWVVLEFFECQISWSPDGCAEVVARALRQAAARAPGEARA